MQHIDFKIIFNTLKEILENYSGQLQLVYDKPEVYYLDTDFIMKNKKPLFFGSVKIGKNYVSFHLMPVYVDPTLLDSLSVDLQKRMQGKSCFNFNRSNQILLQELTELTKKCFKSFQDQGYITQS